MSSFRSPRHGASCPTRHPPRGRTPTAIPIPEWLRIDWREHLSWIEVGGARVNYAEMGPESGKAIVFVHGLSGAWQNWLENLPHFARGHRVIAMDLPGFGASPMPPWDVGVEAYGRFLHELCDALGVRTCTVVGNSMGGFIAAEAATVGPQRIDKLVLVSAAGISHARMRREPAEVAARMGVMTAPLTIRLFEGGLRRPRLRRVAFAGIFHAPETLRSELLYEFFRNGTGKPGVLPAVRGLVGYDILDRLTEVEVPTLIVWGRNDHIVPPNDALGYGQRLRNSSTVIFDQTGHVPMAERPVRFNRVLETFLGD